jgi:acyl-CoA synthetase (NDP forming)
MAHQPRARRQDLTPLLRARSVAVVGISQPGRFGGILYENLRKFGYPGRIFPVNPRYESIHGLPCHPSLRDLPERPDCALLAVPNQRLKGELEAVAECGIPAAAIFASAWSEPEPGQPSLEQELARVARASGTVVCGPNCMGFVSLRDRLPASGYAANPDTPAGGVTLITHSGSVWDAFLQNRRGVAFNYVVSAGNEIATTAADYMQFALGDESTRVIGVYLETVRDPDTFRAALAEAAERDVPVVVLKTGRTERGAALAQAHSGALAGEDAVYDALFRHYGVQRVTSIDEMMDTLELFAAGLRPPTRYIASIHDSGGQRSLTFDLAEATGVEFADISADTAARLASVLEPGLEPINPLDAWGTGNGADDIYAECLLALDADPATGLTLFAVDLYGTDDQASFRYPEIVAKVRDRLRKPLAWLVHLSAAASDRQMRELRAMGIPILMGTETGLRAAHHLLDHAEFQRRRASAAPEQATGPRPSRAAVEEARRRLAAAPAAWDEHESKQLLAAYGLAVTRERIAGDEAEALAAAEEIGYPVALKTAEGKLHKTESRGVVLDVEGPDPLSAAYRDLSTRLGPRVLVQEMVPRGVELILGVARDPQFGLVLTVGSGGILVEMLKDARVLLPPVSPQAVREALGSLRGAALLRGVRGAPPVDVEAVVRAATGLAALATELGDHLAEVDVNPLIALPDRAVVADALVVPRRG